jgi:2-methylfumaryl-CoA isomerase
MIIALTRRQWLAIGEATGLGDRLAMIGKIMDVDLDTEAGRYDARDMISALLARWCASHTLEEVRHAFAGAGVLWGHFQEFLQLVRDDPRCSEANPLFAIVDQPGIGRYLMPGLPLDFSAEPRLPPRPAPLLGEHTDVVLSEVLGLSSAEISRLHDKRIVVGPDGR